MKHIKLYNFSLKLSVLATALFTGTLAVLLSDIIGQYALVGTQEGLMSSMISIGGFVALVVSILLQGKFKKTTIITACGLLAAGMSAVMGIGMPFALFLLCCLLMGFGNGALDSFQSSFLADLNQGDTARHMGALHGTFGLGGILTPIFLHALLKNLNWQIIYVVVGVVGFLLVAQFAVVTRIMKVRLSVASRKEPKFTISGLKEFLTNPYAVLVLLCIFFGAAAQSGVIVWTIRYVMVFLKSPDIAAACLSVFWVASTVSRFCAPMLPYKPAQILTFGALMAAVAWAVALVINTPIALCVACALVGLGNGPIMPMSLSEGASVNPNSTGLSTNILMMVKTGAQILSPILLAFLMSVTNMHIGMFATCVLFLANFAVGVRMIQKRKES